MGRLFWKLLLALFSSMALSVVGALAYIALVNAPPPVLPEGALAIGPVPMVPLVSGTLAILMVGLILAWYISRPIRRLRWALRRIADGHLDTRVAPLMTGWRDEIADLGQDFDRMAEQLQKALGSRRVLLHDVSHELRSPLARMQAAIGLLHQDPASAQEMLLRIEVESARLDALIEELLMLRRLNAGASMVRRDRVDLIELLQAIAEDADFEARASGRKVTLQAPQAFVAQVQGELICRAFENVIRNAVKYSPLGGAVEVRAFVDEQQTLRLSVADRGPGVPAELLAQIFEPFFRVGGANSVGGTGLGLAIAQRAMAAHGGHMAAHNRQGGGLEIVMHLPPHATEP
ncbi:MAG: Sensor histidine kinase CpxA [Paracidovorax wautersii]|uniref:histidine kinase n=1 Tax=Paracidovorax wautersii TaxID=1177982 RepID=A0A7V8FN19_9BURK|nr:MAG: Sensor histidine kinase CpxA [Paracidovorax wautersii]